MLDKINTFISIFNFPFMKSISIKALSFSFLLFFSFSLSAQVLNPSQIDSLVQKAMETFDVPGMAIAVLKDGEVYHKNTYGIRSVRTKAPVNENTLFGVASNTKAFTTAALGQLIEKENLIWNIKVKIIK